MELPPPLNHVFVDYENVQALDLSVIGSKGVTFTLLLGPKMLKLDVDLVERLVANAASVEFVRLKTSGKNALDFTLAYYLGRAVVTDPTGYFHLISKDTGYDPMIEHLRSRHIRARRHDSFATLTFSAPVKPKVPAIENGPAPAPANTTMARAIEHLQKHPNNRPKRRKTLESHLHALLGAQLTEAAINELVESLIKRGHIAIDGKGAVTYKLPAA